MNPEIIRLKISKLDPATDTAHLEKALEAVPGVRSVEIDPSANEAIVRHEDAEPGKLTQALRQQGYVSDIV